MALAIGAILAACLTPGGAQAQSDQQPLARIAFASASRIFTIEADGSDRLQLTGGMRPYSSDDFAPVWSPDGTTIAFVRSFPLRRYDEGSQIYLMRPDGSEKRALTPPDRVYVSDPQWSPDGNWLAFTRTSTESSYVSSIVVIRSDGGEQRTIVEERIDRSSSSFAFVGEPAWSPDGTRLAFTRTVLSEEDYNYHPTLYLIDADGTNERLLVRDGAAAAWSPDGSKIAFASVRDQNGFHCPGEDECIYNGEIYVMNSDGTNLVRLTENEGDDYDPDWSADGTRLVFSSDRNYPDGESPELYSIEPDGDCLTWLTNGSPESAIPDWEPRPEASTHPGGCGATSRPPLVEFDARRALRIERYPVFWLGTEYRGMLLSWIPIDRFGAVFRYDDCASYEPHECGTAVQLQEEWICSKWSGRAFRAASFIDRFVKLQGILLGYFGWDNGLAAYTGTAQVDIFLWGPRLDQGGLETHLRVLRALIPVDGSEPVSRFQRPVLARHLVKEIRRVGKLYRRLGSIRDVGREIGEDPTDTRSLLISARALRWFGPVDTISCPRRVR